jgi:serine/threonine protein kinase
MENIPAGDLLFYIKKSNGFDESIIKQIASEILFGLKLMHKEGVIYRGLKA